MKERVRDVKERMRRFDNFLLGVSEYEVGES